MQAAGRDPSHPDNYRIASMLFPSDDDVTRYNLQLDEMGFPKASTVMKNPSGQPRLRADGTVDIRYGAVADCRFCAVWASRNPNKIDRSSWTDAEREGRHNPRRCPQAIQKLLKEGELGRRFLEERGPRWKPS